MIPKTMNAAVFRGSRPNGALPLSLENVPVPTPGDGETLLKVLACGVCLLDGGLARMGSQTYAETRLKVGSRARGSRA